MQPVLVLQLLVLVAVANAIPVFAKKILGRNWLRKTTKQE